MSHDPYPRRPDDRPVQEVRRIHPLEEVLRLIDRDAPRPFSPREFLARSGADPDQLSAILEHLALEGLVQKVQGRSLEEGNGIVLTRLGEEVVRDPAKMA